MHVERHVIGCIGTRDAQLDAVTRSILLPLTGQVVGKWPVTVNGGCIESTGRRTGDPVAPRVPGPDQAQIQMIAGRHAKIAGIGALPRRIADLCKQVQPRRILGEHDLQLGVVTVGGEGLRIRPESLPIIGVAIDAQGRRTFMHIQRGIRQWRLHAQHIESPRQRARRSQQGLFLALP